MPLHVLLTGAAGFIGSHLGEALLARGDTVVGLDSLVAEAEPAPQRRDLEERSRAQAGFRFVEGDVRDGALLQRLFASERFDAVIHLAALTGVRPSLERAEAYADVNVRGTLGLLGAARRGGARRFVFASSSSVYGAREAVPFREDDALGPPLSPYAATKQAGEALCRAWHHPHGMDVTVLRYFTVHGPRQRPDMAFSRFARWLIQGEPLPLFGGEATERDYTYVDDIVRGTVAALDGGGGFQLYNLGSARRARLGEVVALLARELGVTARVRALPSEPGDMPVTWADVSLARERLGYEPRVSLEEGLRRFAGWFARQPPRGAR